MEALRQYIISVVTAAILCGILTGIVHKGISKEVIKLICGAFLAITLLRPVLNIQGFDFSDFGISYSQEAAEAAAQGENYSTEAVADIIKAETESYILDKAGELNLSVRVEVSLRDDGIPIPTKVRLTGAATPLAKQKLEEVLTKELGIAKENLIWTG